MTAMEMSNNVDRPQIDLWHARMLLARGGDGDAERARALLLDARERFGRLGFATPLAMVEASLREHALAT